MRHHRFNTKVGTSRGLGAYRNKGSDYLELAPNQKEWQEEMNSEYFKWKNNGMYGSCKIKDI